MDSATAPPFIYHGDNEIMIIRAKLSLLHALTEWMVISRFDGGQCILKFAT